MKKMVLPTLLMSLLLSACYVVPAHRGRSEMLAVPLLPPVVMLDAEPYYFYNGYYYHYDRSRWYYSHARGGPWLDLPRDHYPREVRFKERRDHRREHDRDRDYDYRRH